MIYDSPTKHSATHNAPIYKRTHLQRNNFRKCMLPRKKLKCIEHSYNT